ncbi:type IX secretion system membrane protein PorP/SprF [Muricauda sp. JGD-17]|uniref:Type IX secretion system membrane protein PorP/SprF n=1 Tax=Flagellimonas ochracea TaxID=2696472 RepID=A0A964WW74_9FLAO|nr:PorP/SprF family type IX secretion system membrane protein [Allomuricauda ochracea]NAY90731.1 type IX secretion system membrane protein PorP/SprF [Allomuricauda ochracea]
MRKILLCYLMAWTVISVSGQELSLPTDFRQHTLTHFNANLLNATYAFDWNAPNSISLWTRWQWQTVDGDPTTIFANYTHQINPKSAFALGFVQHNTGTFLDVGANLGYVYVFHFDSDIQLMAGLNLFAFQEKLADDRFVPDPQVELPELDATNSFVLQFSPSVRLQVNRFGLGLAFENAVGLDVSEDGGTNSGNFKIITGTLSNDFPVSLFSNGDNSFVRPVVYMKSIPDGDTQFGINGLLSTSKFWLQGGYNNFYGVSGGIGVTFAKSFSIGGLMEFGTDTALNNEDPTIELLASYSFGKPDSRKKVVGFDVEKDDALAAERMRLEGEQRKQQELTAEKEAEQEEAERQFLLKKQQHERDSIARLQRETEKVEQQRMLDSIAALQKVKVEVKPNERYQEVKSEDGLIPGFYLITNVFGTKKYYENFMQTLRKRGLEPKSFYRSANKYNYVYLERYNTINEARKARDSKFFGKYTGEIWIFRVRGD